MLYLPNVFQYLWLAISSKAHSNFGRKRLIAGIIGISNPPSLLARGALGSLGHQGKPLHSYSIGHTGSGYSCG